MLASADARPPRLPTNADAAAIVRHRASIAALQAQKLTQLADATAKLQQALHSKLIDVTLLRLYPKEHARGSMRFLGTPPGYAQNAGESGLLPQASQQTNLAPTPPVQAPPKPPQ